MIFEKMEFKISQKEQILKRLAKITEPKKLITLAPKDKIFIGKFSQNGFKLVQNLRGGRNSFAPVILGEFIVKDGEDMLKITMRLHLLVLIFMIFFVGFGLAVFGIGVKNLDYFQSAVGLTLAIFGCALCIGFFRLGARKARKIFAEILKDAA